MNAKETRAGQLYADVLETFGRKQHLDNVQVLLNLFLAAMGKPLPAYATVKSPTALSRFLNHAPWNVTAMIRVMRHHAHSQLKAYRKRCVGRSPRLELMVDLTSIAKEGRFEGLGDWMHTLNSVHGVHVVLLYLCCGELRLPWSFLIWRGKGQPSPTQLALKLLRGLPSEVRNISKTIHLLADAGFSSTAFIQGVNALKFAGFIGMRADRKTSAGQRLRDIMTSGRRIEVHDLPGVPLWITWVWLPAKKGDAQERRFIVSTVPRTTQVIKRSGKRRWKIEALFKTLKSRFGFGKFGQHSKRGVLRFLCLSVLSFLLCHFEFLDRPDPGDPAWPNWGKLARYVRQKFLAEVRLAELALEINTLNAVQDAFIRM
ncbi:transposase [Deinococcus sp. KNUC1210]|uniref:transposase n=1 Tax=Deinococcus sp. KNUC1210 TaxID=2917691 RepID=UPI001EF143AF|nr:transposase [Deinococcus sp. KNUC1210]ULH15971.1 transposase [Deinococcus sp. KNUC1210]